MASGDPARVALRVFQNGWCTGMCEQTATARKAIEGLDDIAVSHDNCPHQSILCGVEESVDVALDAAGPLGSALGDGRGYTAGRAGFTSKTGDLVLVVRDLLGLGKAEP